MRSSQGRGSLVVHECKCGAQGICVGLRKGRRLTYDAAQVVIWVGSGCRLTRLLSASAQDWDWVAPPVDCIYGSEGESVERNIEGRQVGRSRHSSSQQIHSSARDVNMSISRYNRKLAYQIEWNISFIGCLDSCPPQLTQSGKVILPS